MCCNNINSDICHQPAQPTNPQVSWTNLIIFFTQQMSTRHMRHQGKSLGTVEVQAPKPWSHGAVNLAAFAAEFLIYS